MANIVLLIKEVNDATYMLALKHEKYKYNKLLERIEKNLECKIVVIHNIISNLKLLFDINIYNKIKINIGNVLNYINIKLNLYKFKSDYSLYLNEWLITLKGLFELLRNSIILDITN